MRAGRNIWKPRRIETFNGFLRFGAFLSLFSPATPEPVNARRVAFIIATTSERAKGYAIGGRNYWKG